MEGLKVLVIGDSHIDETQDLRRFAAAGNLIGAERPDYVISIGDFLSFNCLSEWDKNNRKTMEGKRYHKEVLAGAEAVKLLKKKYKPTKTYSANWVFIEGNHEYRLPRYLNQYPVFDGSVNIQEDLGITDWQWVPYKTVLRINGVGFTHIPINGLGRPIGNPNVATKAVKLFDHSVVFGHTHTLDHAAEHRHGGAHLHQALGVGCFFEHVDEYAMGSKTDYWRGLVMMDIYGQNRFDFRTIAMSQLLKQYG